MRASSTAITSPAHTWAGARRRRLCAVLAPDGGNGGGVRRRLPPGRLLPLQLRCHVHIQQRAPGFAEARGRGAARRAPKVLRGRLRVAGEVA